MGDAVEESGESYVAQEEIVIFSFFEFRCGSLQTDLYTACNTACFTVKETVWAAYS
jgi:hypothetical protein